MIGGLAPPALRLYARHNMWSLPLQPTSNTPYTLASSMCLIVDDVTLDTKA